jgi:transcriptional regulator with XRE-family HTH domain
MTVTSVRVKKYGTYHPFPSETPAGTLLNVPIGDRVKALRNALGLTHEAVAKASYVDENDQVRRTEMSKIENGANALTSFPKRRALARGLAVPLAVLSPYLDEEIDLAEALRRKDAPPTTRATETEIDPRYPNLARAVEFARGQVCQEAIDKTIATALQSDTDPEPRDWWAMIELEDRLIKLRSRDPAGTASRKAADVERTRALGVELAPGARRRQRDGR